MTNIILDQFPSAVLINGREVPIRTDFRAGIRVLLAFEDDSLTDLEKQSVMLEILYPEPQEDLQQAALQAIRFLNGGESETGSGSSTRVYSFAKDANFIFAAFRQTHGIDLETADLHWWKFMALFMDLGKDTTFCQLVGLRKKVYDNTATKEERKAARDLGDIFDIPQPDTRSLDEKDQAEEFFRLVHAQVR